MRRLILVSLLAACGQGAMSTKAATCGDIAAEYHAVWLDAVACDPKASGACTEWRPLAVAVGTNTADARITGLCFTSGAGYVTSSGTRTLDAVIAYYKDEGCALSDCPGLPTILNQCTRNQAGKFTCGGY